MNQKLTKQERDKFLNDLEAINLESDSEMEDSFYEKECKRMNAQISNIKSQQNWSVLQQLKKNVQQEDDMMTEYEKDRQQLHKITSNQTKNVIDANIINAIKQKVSVQTNNSLLSLADQQYNQSLIANPSLLQPQQPLANASFHKVKSKMENKMKAQETAILKKIEAASQQRQHDAMQQEDKLSMKNELQILSEIFKNRFIRPSFPPPKQQDAIIKLHSTKIASSLVRLVPQPISEQTVLPKNAPQIALKQLKLNKKKNLKSTGNGQVKIIAKKMSKQKVQSEEIAIQKKLVTNKQNQVDSIFIEYLKKIKPLIAKIEGIANQYHPHFLRYLQEEEKNLNYQLQQDSTKQGKQRTVSQVASLQNSNSLCQLKLTFEKLTKLKGIQSFTNLEQVQLQFNLLKSVEGIHSCKKIIQLNLSHNRINNITPLNSLPWLRFLNVQHNLLQSIAPQCSALEALLASNNRIHEINLVDLKQLRILQLHHNRLHSLPQLQLLGLQQLGLSHNQLGAITGVQHLLLLKKLDLSHNRIDNIDTITFLYLNSVDLSHNWLTNISQIFLPCLQHLQLTHNRLATRPKGLAYLPNLKELNIDDNRLEGFGYIWWLLRFSRQMQILRYGNNECFLVLREKVRQVYQSLLYKNLTALKILNDAATDSGLAQYYHQNYSIYSDGAAFFQYQGPLLKSVQSSIRLLLRQMTFSTELQKNQNPFSRDQAYINYLWKHKVAGLKRVLSLTDDKQKQIFVPPSLFHYHDIHQNSRRNLFHLLRGVVLAKILRRKRKLKHFLKLKPKIIEKLATLQIQYGNSQLRKVVAKFKMLLRGMNQTQAAVKIQKVWRGYIRRKIYLKLIGKKPKDEDSDGSDVDIGFFDNQLQKVEFDIDLQGFEDVIIRPEVFELLQAKQKEAAAARPTKENKEGKLQKEQKNPLNNNFLDSRTRLDQPHQLKAENEAEKMMREWHIKDPKLLKALQYKQQKKEEMKRKQLDKNMTAAQRYQRFKRGGH